MESLRPLFRLLLLLFLFRRGTCSDGYKPAVASAARLAPSQKTKPTVAALNIRYWNLRQQSTHRKLIRFSFCTCERLIQLHLNNNNNSELTTRKKSQKREEQVDPTTVLNIKKRSNQGRDAFQRSDVDPAHDVTGQKYATARTGKTTIQPNSTQQATPTPTSRSPTTQTPQTPKDKPFVFPVPSGTSTHHQYPLTLPTAAQQNGIHLSYTHTGGA